MDATVGNGVGQALTDRPFHRPQSAQPDEWCVVLDRYEQVSEDFRQERTWRLVLRHGVGLSVPRIVPTGGRVLALDTLTGLHPAEQPNAD